MLLKDGARMFCDGPTDCWLNQTGWERYRIFYFFSLDGALLRLVGLLSEPVVGLLAPGPGPIFCPTQERHQAHLIF